jgi:putative acetyltransferase
MVDIAIQKVDPRDTKVRQLIKELDDYMAQICPSEGNFGLDLEDLAQAPMRFYAVTVDGKMLGCGGFWLHDGYAEVKRVYIHPRSWGLGLGRKIMAHLEGLMLRESRMIARLETGISQPDALGLYQALGYVERSAFGG